MHACFAVHSQAMVLVRRHLPMEFAMPNASERQTHARTCGTRPSSLDGITGQGPESPSLAKGVAGIIAGLRKAGPSLIQIIGIVCAKTRVTKAPRQSSSLSLQTRVLPAGGCLFAMGALLQLAVALPGRPSEDLWQTRRV